MYDNDKEIKMESRAWQEPPRSAATRCSFRSRPPLPAMSGERPKRSRFGDAPPADTAASASGPEAASAASAASVDSTAPAPGAQAAAGGEAAPEERVLPIKKKIYPPIVQYPNADFSGLVKRERSRIQAESNTVIKVCGFGGEDPNADRKELLHILIQGELESDVHKAEKLVRDVINDPAKMGAPIERNDAVIKHEYGRLVGGLPGRSLEEYQEVEILVPNHLAGGIIGRNGETIKQLQDQSGCKIHVARESEVTREGQRLVTVRGPPGNLKLGVDLIEGFVRDRTAAAAANASGARSSGPSGFEDRGSGAEGFGPDAIVVTMPVPHNRCGVLIGRQASTIHHIQGVSGCKIIVPGQPDPASPEFRIVTIVGKSQRAIEVARAEIEAVISGTANIDPLLADRGGTSYKIPNDHAGKVIGRGGATIKAIQERCRVRVTIPSNPDPGTNLRTISIFGDPQNVQDCIREIEELLGGRLDSMGHGGGGSSGVGGSWATHTATAAAATGTAQQPDYSAAWAEYYKQLQLLPEDQQRAALELAQKQMAAAAAAQQQLQLQQQSTMTPEQYAQWQAYYAAQGRQ